MKLTWTPKRKENYLENWGGKIQLQNQQLNKILIIKMKIYHNKWEKELLNPFSSFNTRLTIKYWFSTNKFVTKPTNILRLNFSLRN